MDSGSGSLQSSSGGDEEYDSHHQQHPPLFTPAPPLFFNANIPPPLSSQHQHQLPFHLSHHNYQNLHPQPTTFYDFPSTTFNLQPSNFNPDSSNSFFNTLDVVRPNPTSLRSDPADGSTHSQVPNRSTNPSSSGVLHPKPTTKKRTRASRRAPTTVLTTDTTNFRAMVQEFTGIPSPPFTAAGSSYSRRFDLFGSVRTNPTPTNLEPSGSGSALYPSRSKVQLFSSLGNNNVAVEDQNASSLQQAQAQVGIFSFQSVSEGTHLEAAHIHGSSSTSQQLLSALQSDEAWRGNGGGTAATSATAAAVAAAATRSNNNNNNAAATTTNCKLKFTGCPSSSSNNLQRDKEILLGNFVSTTRGESTVDSWICPSD